MLQVKLQRAEPPCPTKFYRNGIISQFWLPVSSMDCISLRYRGGMTAWWQVIFRFLLSSIPIFIRVPSWSKLQTWTSIRNDLPYLTPPAFTYSVSLRYTSLSDRANTPVEIRVHIWNNIMLRDSIGGYWQSPPSSAWILCIRYLISVNMASDISILLLLKL